MCKCVKGIVRLIELQTGGLACVLAVRLIYVRLTRGVTGGSTKEHTSAMRRNLCLYTVVKMCEFCFLHKLPEVSSIHDGHYKTKLTLGLEGVRQ